MNLSENEINGKYEKDYIHMKWCGIHVEAFSYLLTHWVTTLSWKQQIQNGTKFEQGKIYGSGHSEMRKNYDRGNFGWLLSKECILDEKLPLSSAIKSEMVEKGKEGWESLVSGFNTGRKWMSCTSVVSQLAYIADIHRG